jgi:hypothetical protein
MIGVHSRSLLILALCLILATVRVAGTHVHLERSQAGSSAATTHPVVVMADEDSPLHAVSHLFHGDIDADDSVQTVAKLFLLAAVYAPALILIALVGLLEPRLMLRFRAHRPELRPPARRSAFDLTPPSHAPPVAP